jgi:hypothetical protein
MAVRSDGAGKGGFIPQAGHDKLIEGIADVLVNRVTPNRATVSRNTTKLPPSLSFLIFAQPYKHSMPCYSEHKRVNPE